MLINYRFSEAFTLLLSTCFVFFSKLRTLGIAFIRYARRGFFMFRSEWALWVQVFICRLVIGEASFSADVVGRFTHLPSAKIVSVAKWYQFSDNPTICPFSVCLSSTIFSFGASPWRTASLVASRLSSNELKFHYGALDRTSHFK